MTRFDDSPNLFGGGVGYVTAGEFMCIICGTVYHEGADETEEYDDEIRVADFAGGEVCGNCFEFVEDEILRRMPNIIPWYKKILADREKSLDQAKKLLDGLP